MKENRHTGISIREYLILIGVLDKKQNIIEECNPEKAPKCFLDDKAPLCFLHKINDSITTTINNY
jgi:hypothetical protein